MDNKVRMVIQRRPRAVATVTRILVGTGAGGIGSCSGCNGVVEMFCA